MQAIQNLLKHNLPFSIYNSEDTFDDQINYYVNCSFYKTRIIENGKRVNITCGDDLYRKVKPFISHVVSKGKNANCIGFDYVSTYVKVFLKVWNENYQEWRESKIIEKHIPNNETIGSDLCIVQLRNIFKKPFEIRVKACDCYRSNREFFDDESEDESITLKSYKEKKCVVFLNNEPEVLFYDCVHYCVCHECEERKPFKKCPCCRIRILTKIIV